MLKRFSIVVGACAGIWHAFGCTPATRMPTTINAKPAQSTIPTHLEHRPDPVDVPTFVQHAGKAALTELGPAEATVVAKLRTAQATYLLLRSTHEQVLPETMLDSVTDTDGRTIMAAVAGSGAVTQSLSSPAYELVLRLGGDMRLASIARLHWSSRGNRRAKPWQGGYGQTLTVVGTDTAPIDGRLEAQFGESIARWFELITHREPFAAFAAARALRKLSKSKDLPRQHFEHPDPARIELSELMDFYTGRSAIDDSLQVRRGLQLDEREQAHTETLDSLQPDTHRAEPSRPMTRDGSSELRPCPGCMALSVYLPADALVVEFAALKDLVQLPRLLDRKLGAVLRVAEASGGSSHLLDRYRRQIAIELDGFAETVGQFAVKNAAIVLSDPYLREGTDITLVLKAENPSLLQGVLESHLQRARHEHPDLRTTQEQIAGQSVALHSTPDNRVCRFEYSFDDYRVLSNSRSAISRMIRVKRGTLPSLAEDGDYAAARSQHPFEGTKERAWLYFGSGFVANLIAPRSKILEARRLRARSELLAVDHAALLYGWMEGRRPASMAELLRSGWLENADLVHSDGTRISWSPANGAHSTWGYAQTLAPLADLPIGKVSKDEAKAYRAFRRRYEAEMSGMLDPTMLRFERTTDDEEIQTELSVFPIPLGGRFNSDFRHVAELVGAGRVEAGRATAGLSATIGIGDDSPLRELFDSNLGNLFGRHAVSASFVGDWAKIGFDDGSAVWDLAGHDNLIPSLGDTQRTATRRLDIDHLIPRLPVWVALHIRSRLLLAAAMTALRTKLESSSAGVVKWREDESYRGVQIMRVHIQEGGSTDAINANVYYAVARDILLISLRRDVLKSRVNEVLAGATPRGVPLENDSSQLVLDWAPKLRGWMQSTAAGVLDQAAIDAHERACSGLRVLAYGYGQLPGTAEQRRLAAVRLLGYEPEAPQGGELQWQNGQCAGGSYGTAVEPIVPDVKNPGLLLHEILSSIALLRVTLGMIPHPDALELRAKFQLSHGPSSRRP